MKNKLIEYFIQVCIVVIGVFLGMWVTNWSNSRQQNKNQQQVLQSVLKEIQSNQTKLQTAIVYHRKVFTAFDSVRMRLDYNDPKYTFSGQTLKKFLPGWQGVDMPNLDNAMFDMAKYSNTIPGMPYQIREKLSRIYNFQYNYNRLTDKIIDRFFDFNEQTPFREAMSTVWIMREGGYGSELNAIKLYAQAIGLIKKELNIE